MQATLKTLVDDARAALAACAGLNARTAARLIARAVEARIADTGLTLAQFGLMSHVAVAGDDTVGGLAARTGLDQTTLSRGLRILEAAGLVEIAAVERDMRRRAVWLTEDGARRLEAAMPGWRAAQAEIAAAVDPASVRALAEAAAALGTAAGREEKGRGDRSPRP